MFELIVNECYPASFVHTLMLHIITIAPRLIHIDIIITHPTPLTFRNTIPPLLTLLPRTRRPRHTLPRLLDGKRVGSIGVGRRVRGVVLVCGLKEGSTFRRGAQGERFREGDRSGYYIYIHVSLIHTQEGENAPVR